MPTDVTDDALFDGALRLLQPAKGYRVNVDALLVAAFAARGRCSALTVDLGAGVGAIGLALGHVGAAARIVLLEREPELVELAQQNLARATTPGEVIAIDLDAARLPASLAQRADLVVCNPPFHREGSTRRHHHRLAARARSGDVRPFLMAAARAIRGTRGRAVFAFPAPALPELFASAERAGLVPKRLRCVHARSDEPARLALVELRRARPGGLVVEAPLVEWASSRARTAELADVVSGRFGPNAP